MITLVSGSSGIPPVKCSGSLPFPPSRLDVNSFLQKDLDFLIVGGGTAGMTLGARLSENPRFQVGVLEAGNFLLNNPIVDVPGNVGMGNGNPQFDWAFTSTPQAYAANRTFSLPRGKMLGGSSGINGMAWTRASKPEYDIWQAFAPNSSWSWEGLLPFFKKTEHISLLPENPYPGISPGAAAQAKADLPIISGTGGPINVSYNSLYFDVVPSWVDALNAQGVTTNADPLSGNNTGVYNTYCSIDREEGVRSYSAISYYCRIAERPNLHVLLGSQATKILFAPRKAQASKYVATGVEFVVNQSSFTVNVSKEVILSSGTIQSPQLLELSGIGNSTHLRTLGINPIVDLPQVGENFQEHLYIPVQWQLQPGHETYDILRNNATFAKEQAALYNITRTGLLASTDNTVSYHQFNKFVDRRNVARLLQIFDREAQSFITSPLRKLQYSVQRSWIEDGIVAYAELIEWSRGLFSPALNQSYVTVIGGLMHPTSRGSVHISNRDPLRPPNINPNFLSTQFDTMTFIEIAKYIEEIGKTSPFSRIVSTQTFPDETVQTADDFIDYIQTTCAGGDHLIGTVAMAPENFGGVVDHTLKVYGTSNLRVVDASIIPLHIAAHIQATVYAIAEKAAELIKAGYHG